MLKAYEGILVIDVVSASDLRVADVSSEINNRSRSRYDCGQRASLATPDYVMMSRCLCMSVSSLCGLPHICFHTSLPAGDWGLGSLRCPLCGHKLSTDRVCDEHGESQVRGSRSGSRSLDLNLIMTLFVLRRWDQGLLLYVSDASKDILKV